MKDSVESDIADLRAGLDSAFCDIIDQTLIGMALCDVEPLDRDALRAAFARVLESCSAHDLAGQRLSRIQSTLDGSVDHRIEAHLLNGPASGPAPDQAAIDALFEDDRRGG